VKVSFLLSTAAALVALHAAAAAELPSRQARPAPAAKTCRVNGRTGVVVPGSGACVLLSGSVSAQAGFGSLSKQRAP